MIRRCLKPRFLKHHSRFLCGRERLYSALVNQSWASSGQSDDQQNAKGRIDEVMAIMNNDRMSTKRQMTEYNRIYRSPDDCLFIDIEQREEEAVLRTLLRKFRSSSETRSFFFNEVFKLYDQEKYADVIRAVDIIEKSGQSMLDNQPLIRIRYLIQLQTNDLPQEVANFIVRYAIEQGDYISGVEGIFKFHRRGIKINSSILSSAIRSLITDTNVHRTYNSFMLMKIFEEFSMKGITFEDICNILDYYNQDKGLPFFGNILFAKLKLISLDVQRPCLNKFFEVCKTLIVKNLSFGSVHRGKDIWLALRNWQVDFEKSSLKELNLIITSYLDNEKGKALTEFIGQLSTELWEKPELMTTMLRYFGSHDRVRFSELFGKLEAPLSRETLSVLLESFMIQENEPGSRKILHSIFNSKGGLRAKDFKIIIEKLISQGNIGQCISMSMENNILVSKFAFISIFEQILKDANDEHKQRFVSLLVRRFKDLKTNDSALGELTLTVFRHISNCINNRASRSLYIKLLNIFDSEALRFKQLSDLVDIQRFGIPNEILNVCTFHTAVKTKCIKNILAEAIKEVDTNTIAWSIEELRFQGVLLQDVVSEVYSLDLTISPPLFKETILAETYLE